MKKIDIALTTAMASALLLAGCNRHDDWTTDRDTAVCVNQAGSRISDDNCNRPRGYAGGGGGGSWYYYGQNRSIPAYGERASGGSFTRTAGATYFHAPVETAVTRSMAISRGGFGESAHGFGGFGE